MTLLAPLGLLGLLGIVALIIIYIIRPNYQQKFISTTYVWKLSLKYRKKKIPVSKLRNILLIVCQILILTSCALILAKPNKILKAQVEGAEAILIIDSSASMRAGEDETRFERAVTKASDFASEIVSNGGIVSVIIADDTPEYYQTRTTLESQTLLQESFNQLLDNDACSYGKSNLNEAIALCEEVIRENPKAQIYLYTDAQLVHVPETVNLVDVTYTDEWNGAILDAYAEFEENTYSFVVEVACYGKDMLLAKEMEVVLDIQGANALSSDEEGLSYSFTWSVACSDGEPQRLIFISEQVYGEDPERYDSIYGSNICVIPSEERIISYKSAHISLTEEDNYAFDNVFDIYGGQKETIRIQYASELPNTFWTGALGVLDSIYDDRWDIQITEVKRDEDPVVEGFDLYIFEHEMPATLPKDGVVVMVNPRSDLPAGAGFRVTQEVSYSGRLNSLTEEIEHPMTKNVPADNVEISRYLRCSFDGTYETIWSIDGHPALAVKNEVDAKAVVIPFSLHYSNLAVIKEFPVFVYNLFGYFFPTTVKTNSFEVYETVTLNARGTELTVTGANEEEKVFEEFPANLVLSLPGTYTLTQTTFTGKEVTEQIYVRLPVTESNIWAQHDALDEPYEVKNDDDFLEDLLIYIAAALVFLLFAEWWLKSRDAA